MAIVWPCPLTVDAYAAAGREVEFPRPACPSCAGPMVFWSGYRRCVREAGRCRKIFVPRLRCGPCGVSHALLPAFTLAWRLDAAEIIGAVVARGGRRRVRGPPGGGTGGGAVYDRARLGPPVPGPRPGAGGGVRGAGGGAGRCGGHAAGWAGRFALAAIGAAFAAAAGLPGWRRAGRVAVRVGGDRRQADRRQHNLALVCGRQAAFHASYPAVTAEGGRRGPQPARAGRVAPVGGVAEAAGDKLTARERGALARQIAARPHAHPDGSSRTYSRGTIDRWLRAWRKGGGLAALKPA